ncbi:hypothetical protein SNE40_009790 [Patella caerulea]|uniref:Uncharacterized protein n=1 Tax=Patella caerulea TaxID=87958 RepID=A0AAN8PYZ9_PATCE
MSSSKRKHNKVDSIASDIMEKKKKTDKATGQKMATIKENNSNMAGHELLPENINSDLTFDFQGFSENISKSFERLNDRMDLLENNIEKKLTDKITESIRTTIEKLVKSRVNEEISVMKGEFLKEMDVMKAEIERLKSSKFERLGNNNNFTFDTLDDSRRTNIVIKGLYESEGEMNNPDYTLDKVNDLIHDGLKLRTVNVINVQRKASRGTHPGVVIATLETTEQKKQIMENKSSLLRSKNHYNIYIDNDLPPAVRYQQNNLRTILKETGLTRRYRIQGTRIVPNTTSSSRVPRVPRA